MQYLIERTGKKALCALVLIVLLALCAAAAQYSWTLLHDTLNGRRLDAGTEQETVTSFDLRAEMLEGQTLPQIWGWLSMVNMQMVTLDGERGQLTARQYDAVNADADAPWAVVFHGGLGTNSNQMQDIACELSLAGYQVLTPDLYAHGQSDGEISSLGLCEATDVLAWVQWVCAQDIDARIVLMGQDEGALAVLLAAASGLPQAVRAVAVDSAYTDVSARLQDALGKEDSAMQNLNGWLLRAAYSLVLGKEPENQLKLMENITLPTLLIHGTGDQQVHAWQSEDIAHAIGTQAKLYYVEGAAHGVSRYVDPQAYYDVLIGFFHEAVSVL